MKTIIISAITLTLATSGWATGNSHGASPKPEQKTSQGQVQNQGQNQGQSQGQLATGGSAEAVTGPINVTVNNTVSTSKKGNGNKSGKHGSNSGGTPGLPPSTPSTPGTGNPSSLYGSVVEWKVDNGGKINNVPSLANTYVSTSNTCDGYTGFTAALAGGGFGLNFASQRTFCELRLMGMAYQAMNEPVKAIRMIDLGFQLLCKENSNLAKIAEECKEAQEKAPDAPNPAYQSAG